MSISKDLIIALFCLLMMTPGCAPEQVIDKPDPPAPPSFTQNPEDVQFITSDIDLFWRMFDRESPLFTAMELDEQYIEPGTPALSLFYKERIKAHDAYTNLLNSWIDRRYYEDIREQTLHIKDQRAAITDAFDRFGELYPPAVYTDVVFVIGALNTGGVLLPNGQIVVAAEMFAKREDTDIEYLSPWLQSALLDSTYLPVIIIHELVHLQQQQFARQNGLPVGGTTLLDRALMEGSADFITNLILGKFLNEALLSYADPIEYELWKRFQKNMNQNNFTGWLYNGNAPGKTPADLGYYIGFKIAQMYYRNTPDKQQAIKEIIEMKSGNRFLQESGYAGSFHQKE